MKKMPFKIFGLLVLVISIPLVIFCQEKTQDYITCEVNQVYPPLALTLEQVTQAQSLEDLNEYYDSDWIKEYISVEVNVKSKGVNHIAKGKSEVLNQEQKDLIKLADEASKIYVLINYLPKNNLSENDKKQMEFTLNLHPENDAEFPGGNDKLNEYIETTILSKMDGYTIEQYNLEAITFTIDENGKVTNVLADEFSKAVEMKALLAKNISNMPDWKPASYSSGLKVKQDFVFTLGDHTSCTLNTFNVRRD